MKYEIKLIYTVMVLTIFLLTNIVLTKADIIANSYDWRDVYTVMLYSYYLGKPFHFINNLGEAKILSMTLHQTRPQTIFESSRNSVVKDMKSFLQLRGFTQVYSENFNSYNTLQFNLYERVKDKIKGFVIVKDLFGYDAISVTPFALRKHYWVFFFNDNTKSRIIQILDSRSSLPVIFYGDFLSRPWKDIRNPYFVIDEKNFFKNNEKMLEIFAKQFNLNKSWLVLTSGKYLGEGYLLEKQPIAFTGDNIDFLINYMKKNGVRYVEVIGPENVVYGQEILDKSNHTIGVLVRIGRTFTGSPELQGKEMVLRMLPVPEPYASLEIKNVYYDIPMKVLVVVIKNNGNTNTEYTINGIGLFYGKKETFPEFSRSFHLIPVGKTISLPIFLNLNKTPNQIEFLGLYGYEYPLSNYLSGRVYNITPIKRVDSSLVKLKNVYYDFYRKNLVLSFENYGRKNAWVYAELKGFDILGLNRTFFFEAKKISPGQIVKLVYPVELYQEDFNKNPSIEVEYYYGEDKNLMLHRGFATLGIKIVKSPITGMYIWIRANAIYVYSAAGIVVLLVIFFLFKRNNPGKKRKKK